MEKQKAIFISDFDGTISNKDFYWIIIDDYIGERGKAFYKEWKAENKIGTKFLNKIFAMHEFTEGEHTELLNKVSVDPNVVRIQNYMREIGGEFMVLSAGLEYYVKHALRFMGLTHIKVFANKGDYNGIHIMMNPDKDSPYYSEVYGIDKGAVLRDHKDKCETLIFAGDSEPDLSAALEADIVFAKAELANILDEKGVEYFSFESFDDIYEILGEKLK